MGFFSRLFQSSVAEPTTIQSVEQPGDRERVDVAPNTFQHFADKLTKNIRSITPLAFADGHRCLLVEHAYKRGANPALAGLAGIGVAGALGKALGSAMELREYFVIVPMRSNGDRDFAVQRAGMERGGRRIDGTSLSFVSPRDDSNPHELTSQLRDALVAEGSKVIVERRGDTMLIAMAAESDITLGGRAVRNRLLRVASAAVE